MLPVTKMSDSILTESMKYPLPRTHASELTEKVLSILSSPRTDKCDPSKPTPETLVGPPTLTEFPTDNRASNDASPEAEQDPPPIIEPVVETQEGNPGPVDMAPFTTVQL